MYIQINILVESDGLRINSHPLLHSFLTKKVSKYICVLYPIIMHRPVDIKFISTASGYIDALGVHASP